MFPKIDPETQKLTLELWYCQACQKPTKNYKTCKKCSRPAALTRFILAPEPDPGQRDSVILELDADSLMRLVTGQPVYVSLPGLNIVINSPIIITE